ncbi:MAG: acetyl-CoA carboxylase biotin carboxyl carrier protein [Candidatus Omnitrophica bacterium]|nr:acetyl-CoA carboxylase biotin carboxyl carrier protein [Candidatus Omnitrophota bacterium]
MNLKEIKEIVKLMNENELTEIEVEREGSKLKLRKFSEEGLETIVRRPVEYPVPAQSSVPVESVSAAASAASVSSGGQEITSPMVGTFYRAPSPEAPSFVEIGQMVEVGQVVCIVEAMKLMNEIKSEVKGKVVQCLVDNAEPVEFGQQLFVVEPA